MNCLTISIIFGTILSEPYFDKYKAKDYDGTWFRVAARECKAFWQQIDHSNSYFKDHEISECWVEQADGFNYASVLHKEGDPIQQCVLVIHHSRFGDITFSDRLVNEVDSCEGLLALKKTII